MIDLRNENLNIAHVLVCLKCAWPGLIHGFCVKLNLFKENLTLIKCLIILKYYLYIYIYIACKKYNVRQCSKSFLRADCIVATSTW